MVTRASLALKYNNIFFPCCGIITQNVQSRSQWGGATFAGVLGVWGGVFFLCGDYFKKLDCLRVVEHYLRQSFISCELSYMGNATPTSPSFGSKT